MKKIVEHYCKYCQSETKMKKIGEASHIGVYWLRCNNCSNCWMIAIEEFQELAK